MNTQRSRLAWVALSFLITFAAIHCARAAVIGAVKGTNELYFNINPCSANTNYITIGDAGIIDGSQASWVFERGGSLDGTTNTVGTWYTICPGVWHRNPFSGTSIYNFLVGVAQTNYTLVGGTNILIDQVTVGTNSTITINSDGSGTNIFNTTITTNLYITTNTYVIINGGTNQVGLWSDFGTFIAPTAFTNNFQILTNGGVLSGSNSLAFFGTSAANALNVIRQPDSGETPSTGISIYSSSTNGFGAFDVNMSTNNGFVSATWNVGANAGRGIYLNANATEAKISTVELVNGAETWSVNDAGIMLWGPTNVLYRSGSNLVETNGATQVEHEIRNGDGRSAFVGLSSSGEVELRAANGATAVYLANGTDIAVLFGGGFLPNTALDLGSNADRWSNVYLKTNSVIFFGTNQFSTDGANNLTWNGVVITVP